MLSYKLENNPDYWVYEFEGIKYLKSHKKILCSMTFNSAYLHSKFNEDDMKAVEEFFDAGLTEEEILDIEFKDISEMKEYKILKELL